MKLNLANILSATQGKALSEFFTEFSAVATDTRKDMQGQLFVALRGDAHDAHDYVDACVAKGAVAALVDKQNEQVVRLQKQITVILVADTLIALQQIANFYRKKTSSKFLAITGSNGKTTSKEFTAQIISQHFKTHYSKGSFNNHWGVPLSILAQPEDCQVTVLEMGMNHSGEITALVNIADPDAVVVSAVGSAHIEHFGSVERIADAKAEIYQASRQDSIRIFNLDQSWTLEMFKKYKNSSTLSFSSVDKKADVFMQIQSVEAGGLKISGHIQGVESSQFVPILGKHNLTNLMVASSMALAVGVPKEKIWQSLPACKTNWGRTQWVKTESGAHLLFDAYNANPDSMQALLLAYDELPKSAKSFGVFGQMLEMGEASFKAHEELGYQVGLRNLQVVWFYGAETEAFAAGLKRANYKNKSIITASYEEPIAIDVASMLDQDDIVLIKGSRGMKLERFVLCCKPLGFSLNKE